MIAYFNFSLFSNFFPMIMIFALATITKKNLIHSFIAGITVPLIASLLSAIALFVLGINSLGIFAFATATLIVMYVLVNTIVYRNIYIKNMGLFLVSALLSLAAIQLFTASWDDWDNLAYLPMMRNMIESDKLFSGYWYAGAQASDMGFYSFNTYYPLVAAISKYTNIDIDSMYIVGMASIKIILWITVIAYVSKIKDFGIKVSSKYLSLLIGILILAFISGRYVVHDSIGGTFAIPLYLFILHSLLNKKHLLVVSLVIACVALSWSSILIISLMLFFTSMFDKKITADIKLISLTIFVLSILSFNIQAVLISAAFVVYYMIRDKFIAISSKYTKLFKENIEIAMTGLVLILVSSISVVLIAMGKVQIDINSYIKLLSGKIGINQFFDGKIHIVLAIISLFNTKLRKYSLANFIILINPLTVALLEYIFPSQEYTRLFYIMPLIGVITLAEFIYKPSVDFIQEHAKVAAVIILSLFSLNNRINYKLYADTRDIETGIYVRDNFNKDHVVVTFDRFDFIRTYNGLASFPNTRDTINGETVFDLWVSNASCDITAINNELVKLNATHIILQSRWKCDFTTLPYNNIYENHKYIIMEVK